MKKLSAILSLIVFCVFLFLPQQSFAQIFTNSSGTPYELNNGYQVINKGESFTYQIVGLLKNEKYRIELGKKGGRSDEFLQHNIDLSSSRLCYPADFGSSEPNVNTSYSQVNSCNLDTNINAYTMNGTLGIPQIIGNNQGEYTLYLKKGQSGNNIVTSMTLSIGTPKISLTTLSNVSSVPYDDSVGITPGTPVFAEISGLASGGSYKFYLVREDGVTSTRSTVTFSVNNGSCTQTTSGGSFNVDGNCTGNSSGTTARIRIDTNGYNCNPGGDQSTPHTCQLILTSGSGQEVARTNLKVTTANVVLKAAPKDTSQTGIYEDSPVAITVTGCPAGTQDISFYYSPPDLTDVNQFQNSILSGNLNTTKGQIKKISLGTGGTGEVTFGQSYRNKKVLSQAVCSPSKLASDVVYISVGQIGSGKEKIVLPDKINANEAFQATLTNLNYQSEDNCYYVRLNFKDELVAKEEEHQCNGIDGGKATKSVKATAPEMPVDLPALEAGKYNIQLYRADRKMGSMDLAKKTEDEKVDDINFCVGVGDSSQGEDCSEEDIITPPAPPCITPEADGSCNRINTAFGELNIDLSSVSKTIFTLLLSISGGIILLIAIRSGYLLMFSQGNPEKVKEAQDRLTSAFIGFLFLLFSLVILQVIGVDILHIPGIGK